MAANLSMADLEKLACDKATMRVEGLNVIMTCPGSGETVRFRLRLGRPKTFSVSAGDGLVGEVGIGEATAFLWGNATMTPAKASPASMLLLEVMLGSPGPNASAETVDFVAAWDDVKCSHRSAWCQAYGNTISTLCACGGMTSTLHGERFRVTSHNPETDYGMHAPETIIEHVRRLGSLVLPGMMADKMSDDPERDAEGVAALVGVLEEHGLITHTKPAKPTINDRLAASMSVMCVDRAEFERRANYAANTINHTGMCVVDDDHIVTAQQGLEAARLAWPCDFEGIGIRLDYYGCNGRGGFCPKCGFAVDGEEAWRRGCRECGYVGYLLGV